MQRTKKIERVEAKKMLFVLALLCVLADSVFATVPAAQFDVMLDLWTRWVVPDPSKVIPDWQTTPTANTICSYPGVDCDGSDNIIEVVNFGVWVDLLDQNDWDLGDGTRASNPKYHDLTFLESFLFVVSPGSTGILPGSLVECGNPPDFPLSITQYAIITVDPGTNSAITVGAPGVLEQNFLFQSTACYSLQLFALSNFADVAMDFSNELLAEIRGLILFGLPGVTGSNIKLPDIDPGGYLFDSTDLVSLDPEHTCPDNDTFVPFLPFNTLVINNPRYTSPPCVFVCNLEGNSRYTSALNNECFALGGDSFDVSAIDPFRPIDEVVPVASTAVPAGVGIEFGNCYIRRDTDECIDCALFTEFTPIRCQDCNGNNPFLPDWPFNTFDELDVMVRLQQRWSAIDGTKLKPEWQTPPTLTTVCSLPGISCDENCQIIEILMPTEFGVWIDDADQAPWDLGDGTRGNEPLWHRLNELEGLALSVTQGGTGVIPGSQVNCTRLSRFETGADLPDSLRSYGVYGSVSSPPTTIDRGPPGIFEDNMLSPFNIVEGDFVGCYDLTGFELHRLPTIPFEFDSMRRSSGDIPPEIDVSMTFSDMPLLTGEELRIEGTRFKSVWFIRTALTALDDAYLCDGDPTQNFRQSSVFVTGTPTFRLPSCIEEFCYSPGVFVTNLVVWNNDICEIGRNIRRDINVTASVTNSVNETIPFFIFDIFDINFPTADFTGAATIRCTLGRDRGDCVDCFGNEPREGIPFRVFDACGICAGDNSTCFDCAGVPAGSSTYDLCGVCDGGNECLDCAGVPFGTAEYDACDVCCGDNECVDCAGVPNGLSVVDRCGECGGSNACAECKPEQRDLCGVCFGDSSSCRDCTGALYGTVSYDACDVCGGDCSTCLDCNGVANGPDVLDVCGVCGGNGESCIGCDGVVDSGLVYDECGECGGNNACIDCAGVVCGLSVYDECDVCGGDGTSCTDCSGALHGPKKVNVCGQCVDPAEADLDSCDEELLADSVHHLLKLYGGLLIGFLVIAFAVAIICCAHSGGALLMCCFGICVRRTEACDEDFYDRHADKPDPRVPLCPPPAPKKCKKSDGNHDDDSDDEHNPRKSKAKKRCKPKQKEEAPKKTVSVAAGIPSIFLFAILGLVSGAQAQGPPRNGAERLYDELCDHTNAAMLLGCGAGRGNVCDDWPAQFKCYTADNEVVRTADVTGLRGALTRAAWRDLRHAESLRFVGGVMPGNPLVLADWTDAAGTETLFAGFTELVSLELTNVRVGGVELPASLSEACQLRKLTLVNIPDLVGTFESGSAALCSVLQLRDLVVRNTAIGGELQCSGYKLAWRRLETLDVRGNHLVLPLPDLTFLGSLIELYADNNEFDGPFPSLDIFPSTLERLCLAENNLSGPLPVGWDAALFGLSLFYVDGNKLTGPIPDFNWPAMRSFGISNNMFTGSLPVGMVAAETYDNIRVNNNKLDAPFPPFAEEQLCGECAFECNNLCTGDAYIVSPQFEVLRRANCSFSIEPELLCPGGCGDRSCLGCDGVPNSGATVDICGVCGGTGIVCLDCEGVPFGSATRDKCGICNGDNSACVDCAGIPNGSGVEDACGVCNGDNMACADCAGVPNGPSVYDACDVCDGGDASCADCNWVPHGTAVRDEYGVCGGDGTPPNGTLPELGNKLAHDLRKVNSGDALLQLLAALLALMLALCCCAFATLGTCGRYRNELRYAERQRNLSKTY